MNKSNSNTLDRDRCRANLLHYTGEAFRALPHLTNPRILDIGCGTGISTLELVRISGGQVVALDIDRNALDRLGRNAEREGLSDRIMVIHRSMLDMDFPPNSFDIIWNEGAISAIGFDRGLTEWRSLLVADGYLVVHDSMSDLPRKLELAGKRGYTILKQIALPPDVWWDEYYRPLKRQVEALKLTAPANRDIIDDIKAAEREIKEFDPDNPRYGSFFIIMQKA
jgi:SAM-dependent methyltransferase